MTFESSTCEGRYAPPVLLSAVRLANPQHA